MHSFPWIRRVYSANRHGTALSRVLLIVAAACAGESTAAAAAPSSQRADVNAGVSRGIYSRWKDAWYLDSDRQVTAVVLPSVGGRIVHFSKAGDNILYEHSGTEGKTLTAVKEWFMMGGFQTDLGPELRGIPEHLDLWLGAYAASSEEDYLVTVQSSTNSPLGIQLERTVVIDPENGDIGLNQRMKNVSTSEQSYCLWDRTQCRGGGYALIPLNKKSRMPKGWGLHRTVNGKPGYQIDSPVHDRVQILDDILVAWTGGDATKIGADTDAGWIGYVRGRLLFVKYFPVDPQGNYSDAGNTVELYFDRQIAELEPLSPEVKLKPGEHYDFPEKWTLIQLKQEVGSFKEARSVARRILASPFADKRR